MNSVRNVMHSMVGTLAIAFAIAGTGCSANPSTAEGEKVASTSAAVTTSGSAFAWSSQLTGTSTAFGAFASGSNITITNEGAGAYNVNFPGLGSINSGGNFGIAHVTAYGGNNAICTSAGWGGDFSGALEANVRCFSPTGTPTNSLFTVSWAARSDTPGVQGGYISTCNMNSTCSGAPDVRWNSTGQPITVQRTGLGAFSVTFAGQAISGGTAEVTALEPLDPPPTYCEVQSWGSQTVNIRCFTTGGVVNGKTVRPGPADSDFNLTFMEGVTTGGGSGPIGSPNGTSSFTYAWADQPTAASYQPSSVYQKGEIPVPGCCVDTTSPLVTATRSSTGVYVVTFPQMPFSNDPNNAFDKSNVKVSAYGSSGEYCNVGSWTGTSSSASATVRCFDATGRAVDSRYTVIYSSTLYIIG